MRYQVRESKRRLEAQFGITVDSLAYVGGGYDADLVRLVREAGYTSARAIDRGVDQSPANRYALRVSRIGVFDDVVGKTLENAMTCRLDPTMREFEARVTGTSPG
jgi:hypothetical protein